MQEKNNKKLKISWQNSPKTKKEECANEME